MAEIPEYIKVNLSQAHTSAVGGVGGHPFIANEKSFATSASLPEWRQRVRTRTRQHIWRSWPLIAHDAMQQIERFVGTGPAFMHIQIKTAAGEVLLELPPDAAPASTLGEFLAPVLGHSPLNVHVIDSDPSYAYLCSALPLGTTIVLTRGIVRHSRSVLLLQQEPVERYTLSDEAYAARAGTAREWKAQQRSSPVKKPSAVAAAEPYAERPDIEVGDHVSLIDGDHRGVVRFVGRVAQMTGYWVREMYHLEIESHLFVHVTHWLCPCRLESNCKSPRARTTAQPRARDTLSVLLTTDSLCASIRYMLASRSIREPPGSIVSYACISIGTVASRCRVIRPIDSMILSVVHLHTYTCRVLLRCR